MSSNANNTADFACSLNPEEYKIRRRELRERLLPHVVGTEHSDLNIVLKFYDSQVVRSEVETFVDLEKQYCGFLNFVVSPPGQGLSLAIDGPDGSQGTIQAWANGAGGAKWATPRTLIENSRRPA